MRVPRVRFTVWRMMVVVAVVAILTTAVSPELTRRWGACQAAADRQEGLARMYSARVYPTWPALTRIYRDKAALHRELGRRNRWAFLDPFHECVLNKDIY